MIIHKGKCVHNQIWLSGAGTCIIRLVKQGWRGTILTLVNVKAPVIATMNWWWLSSALVLA